jgi:hypothetical protein
MGGAFPNWREVRQKLGVFPPLSGGAAKIVYAPASVGRCDKNCVYPRQLSGGVAKNYVCSRKCREM